MSKIDSPKNAIEHYTFLETKQLLRSDSDALEPKMMLDSDDIVPVDQELPQSDTELTADLSRSEVNGPPGAEVTVSIASALPSAIKLSLPEHDEAVNVDPHENKSMCERSSSTCSDIAEDDGVFCEPSSDHCTGEWEMDNEDLRTVVLYPDHMVYCDSYCTDCVLTFTSSCIKMEGSTLDGDDKSHKTFKFQWRIEDILSIKSHWYELVEMAMVTIHVFTKDPVHAENVECTSESYSGTELKFTVVATNWYGTAEAITSLNVTYKDLWSNILGSEDNVHEHNQLSSMKYFPNFDQPFEVVYPKGDADAVSISKRDADLLQPDTFVNDTIIDFYIKCLKDKIKPEERHRFHFFNSFFFRKLADPDKDQFDASEGRAAFLRVRKWTRKVNIFEKDYVFIPVNYNYHWSLIVMCHLGEVAAYKDEDVTELIKVPCILHMDSIRGSHTGLKGLMQSYLREEWKGRLQEASEDVASRFDNLRFISLELPQQPNTFDCGLFLLHYIEVFLEQAPINFNPFKITNSVNFLNVDWFPPADASLKRVVIQRLIYNLLDHPSHEAPSMAAIDEHSNLSSQTTNIHDRTALDFFPERCHPSTSCQGSQADQGIEISLLPSSSTTTEPCAADPSTTLKPSFEPGSFLGMHLPSFNETTFDEHKSSLMPQIEEDVEAGQPFVYSPTETGLHHGNGVAPEASAVSCSSQAFKSRACWHRNNNLETSVSGCEDSLDVIKESNQTDAELSFKEIGDQPRSPLMEPVEMLDGDADGHDLTLSSRCSEMQTNGPTGSDESSGLESNLQHPTKKMRTMEPPL